MVTKKVTPLLSSSPIKPSSIKSSPLKPSKSKSSIKSLSKISNKPFVKPIVKQSGGKSVKLEIPVKKYVRTKNPVKGIIVRPLTLKPLKIVKASIKRPIRKSALKRTRSVSNSTRNKKRRVVFAPRASYKTYRKDEETNGCILSPNFQTLLKNCYLRHEKIAQIINRNSVHKVLKSVTNDEPLKVYDIGSYWWMDRSPMILHQKLERDPDFLKKFLFLLDYHIRKNQNIGESKPLVIKNNRFKIVFDNILRKV